MIKNFHLMISWVEGGRDKVGCDDALALHENVASDVAVVPGGHQNGSCLIGHLQQNDFTWKIQ